MNGVVESLINSVRKALDASVVNYLESRLTYEEWCSVLCEINYIINSCPITFIGNPEDMNCITSNMLLYPHGQPTIPQYVPDGNYNFDKSLKIVQNRIEVFWYSWLKFMPSQLIERSKWYHSRDNLEIGDLVINFEPGFKGGKAPRSKWMKAIVCELHHSADNLVRSVTIRNAEGKKYVRPIHKLCLIATRSKMENY